MVATTVIIATALVVFAPVFVAAGRIQDTKLIPEITPTSVTTYLGGRVEFNCSRINIPARSGNPLLLAWQTVPDGLVNSTIFVNNDLITLGVIVNKVSYNNTKVYCLGRYQDQPGKLPSESKGTILIQGIWANKS